MSVAKILAVKGRDVATTDADRSLAEAARMLAEKRIGALVVTGGAGEVLGILSERDIIRAVGQNSAAALESPVSQYMTRSVVTCDPSMSLDHLMGSMTTGRFRHLPVVENGRLAGIVSIGDVVKFRVAEIEADAKAMRDYIAMA